ncbi:4Fe-4S dicluster domain-containing protein [Helicobacter cholecystus]|uniref:4Fe-4S dicluster domain-containing protein n=1 Tax=Helicobacter cholecystus TaxID=45498 RepID=A0A3D8IX29_9HELI|nr:4Fe-4S dicluster-binding protein [Helicobacter cholecystus]RDU69540.1 4Fe-4S dicluster domain-containing protein [Helicobacter cholecystus]VEJ24095.1 pyruvate ferredoxin oxidoreductase subunit delta [Helicobacter cholecystus]
MKGWNEFEIGSVLFPFESSEDGIKIQEKMPENRVYTENSSKSASVAHWRVQKPVHNQDICINCFNCWVYCPDAAILARDEKLKGVDYVHCKGCGVCVQVCPTNPKSLLMFDENEENTDALAKWPKKESK